ncbi:hypothetical protein ACFV2V_24305 [Streptomyces sp. NPDC059698]|uniref:hypothetical protein n=1 Tax=unclassified Streptomyces TaxID=2593676 RepID=UPI00095ACBD9|nr:hypothetical protein [Streptomyces sp. CB02366]OKJ32129.1 hypothetical protein AMK24_27390 [Streptomyces sp. CB02366]TVP37473.1 hypothetical protein A3L22_27300 [Streptomyces griseus subsp. griseus]WSS59168.1 hypothetical protein OG543_29165 [Streptomyces sp. NBC_01178]
MHMITMRLVRSPGVLKDLETPSAVLMAQCTPADGVEHVWARSRQGHIDVVFFVLSGCEAEALLAARAVCERALSHEPAFASWRLTD